MSKKLSKYKTQKIIKIACRKNIHSQIIETYLYTSRRQKNISEKKNGTYLSSLKQMNGSQYIIRGNKKERSYLLTPQNNVRPRLISVKFPLFCFSMILSSLLIIKEIFSQQKM